MARVAKATRSLGDPAIVVVSGWQGWPPAERELVLAPLAQLHSLGLIGLIACQLSPGVSEIVAGWADSAGVPVKPFASNASPEEMLEWADTAAKECDCTAALIAYPGQRSPEVGACLRAARKMKIEIIDTVPYPGVSVTSYEMPTGVCGFCRKTDELWPFFNSQKICPDCYDTFAPNAYK